MTLGQAARSSASPRARSASGRIRAGPGLLHAGRPPALRRGDLESFLVRSGPGRQQAGPTVLLVDDDERMRELVRIELEREGYAVQEAASADEGLAAIE